jgi:hypothetical protein
VRTKIIAALLFVSLATPGIAEAKGPSGSSEKKNQVKCKAGAIPQAGPVVIFAGPKGVELCSSDNTAPDGRIIVSTSGYAAVDGDSSNPEQGTGFLRVDDGGPTCDTPAKQDASAGRGGSCAPEAP